MNECMDYVIVAFRVNMHVELLLLEFEKLLFVIY